MRPTQIDDTPASDRRMPTSRETSHRLLARGGPPAQPDESIPPYETVEWNDIVERMIACVGEAYERVETLGQVSDCPPRAELVLESASRRLCSALLLLDEGRVTLTRSRGANR